MSGKESDIESLSSSENEEIEESNEEK